MILIHTPHFVRGFYLDFLHFKKMLVPISQIVMGLSITFLEILTVILIILVSIDNSGPGALANILILTDPMSPTVAIFFE